VSQFDIITLSMKKPHKAHKNNCIKRLVAFLPFLLLLLIFFFPSCSSPRTEKQNLSSIKTDGVYFFRMNHIGEDQCFFGKWTAPKLGRNGKFFRSMLPPETGISFELFKKETIIIEGELYNAASSLTLTINDHSFPVSGLKFRKLIPSKAVHPGKNVLRLSSDNLVQIDIQEIRIFPRRMRSGIKNYMPETSCLTPARLDYYFNPAPETKLELSFLFPEKISFRGKITISTEKNKRSFSKTIKKGKALQIPVLDQSFHHIQIDIPGAGAGLITLERSLLIRPKKKEQGFGELKNRIRNKNILLILLDAARADRLSCYGYKRRTTPNIDTIAENGYIFQNVFSEASYTLASTGTLLTGLPPDYHGVVSAFFNTLDRKIITLPELLQEKGYYTAAVSANPYFGSSYFYDQGFDDFVELFRQSGAVDAEAFIEPFQRLTEKQSEKPFFFYLHVREPHHPYKMPSPFFGRYQQKHRQYSEKFRKKADRIYKGMAGEPADFQFLSDIYDENLAYADHIVGEILKILKEKKLLEKTIIIITADHGEALGEHRKVGHNMVLHREGIRIPLIFHFPDGRKPLADLEKPAITSDLTVTLCDLLDITYPYPQLSRGENLFSLQDKRTRFCRSLNMTSNYAGYMVESFPYRMLYFPHVGEKNIQLYNIKNDPEENNPLTSGEVITNHLRSILFQFVRGSVKGVKSGDSPKLSKKELENLQSLGYIK